MKIKTIKLLRILPKNPAKMGLSIFGLSLFLVGTVYFAQPGTANATTDSTYHFLCRNGRFITNTLASKAALIRCSDSNEVTSYNVGSSSAASSDPKHGTFIVRCLGSTNTPQLSGVGSPTAKVQCTTDSSGVQISSKNSSLPPIEVDVDDGDPGGGEDGLEPAPDFEPVDDRPLCNDDKDTPGIDLQGGGCLPFDTDNDNLADNPILVFLRDFINFLIAGVGIILVGLIILAGIRYAAANGNPQETGAAKSMIIKAVISMFMFAFSTAILNWLMPGGLL